jgi:hypothetical protein
VRFTLDDAQRSEVQKSAIVKRISHNFVGAEFVDFDAFNETNRIYNTFAKPKMR